jgi:uncharacterized protein (TIGR03435 family)
LVIFPQLQVSSSNGYVWLKEGQYCDMKWLPIVACCFAPFLPSFAQQQRTDKPSFEVASVKPSDPNAANPMWVGMSADGALVTYTNITLKDCIRAAYRMRDFQIVGPAWIANTRFEITAKLAAGASPDQIPEMLQALLAERFKLTVRRETKEQSVYALTVGKDGPKLKAGEMRIDNKAPTAVGPDGKPRPAMLYYFSGSGVVLTAHSANLPSFVELMSRFTERPVVDMTGLDGQYEFNLTFAPETNNGRPWTGSIGPDRGPPRPSSDPAPSVFEAVRQYGLRLESRKALLEVLVVMHMEKKPTEN